MKKIILILTIISLSTIYVGFKLLTSFYWQSILMSDWGNSELIIRYDVVEKIDTDFPNITSAALPLASVKMRYFIREGKFDTLNELVNKSRGANPFMGVEENIYAQYLYNIGKYDSAYFYSKNAFNKIKNNQLHAAVYISSLVKIDSLQAAINIFENLENKTPAHYRSLLTTLADVRDTLYLKKYLEESKRLIGNEDEYKNLVQISLVGYENFYSSIGYQELAKIDFDKGFIELSKDRYRKAIEINPYNNLSFKNLGLIFFKQYDDSLQTAKEMLLKSLELNNEDGECFYYLGVIEYANNLINKDSICKIFNKSLEYGYEDARPLMKQYGCIIN